MEHDIVRAMKTLLVKIGVEDVEWPAQSLHLNPTLSAMILNADCMPRHLAQRRSPTSLILLLPNSFIHFQKSGGYYNIKVILNLEWDSQQAYMGVTVRCPRTFAKIVYYLYCHVYVMLTHKQC